MHYIFWLIHQEKFLTTQFPLFMLWSVECLKCVLNTFLFYQFFKIPTVSLITPYTNLRFVKLSYLYSYFCWKKNVLN